SALAGVALGLSPVLTEAATTPNLVHAVAWAPWLLVAARRRSAKAVAVFGALSLLAGAPETSLWSLLLALVVARPRRGAVLLGLAWSAALAAITLLPAAEQALSSARGTSRVDPL